jgi:hypothetical protein
MPPLRRAGVWLNGRPLTTALLVVLVVAVPGYLRVETIAADTAALAEDLELEAARSALDACESRRTTIVIVRQLVEVSYSGDGVGALFTGADGFALLDPVERAYFTNLEEDLNAAGGGGNEAAKARALAVLEVPDCAELEADLAALTDT